ncbi:hypothetical protein HJC23_003310 [Cyclotella cryptica]|uniref:Sugar transporter SWEET1 n=1 Tax=Cyclotella cryptica TaxID=29204 RepID=A0ABD3QXS7_9STRA|eukprot:CCRYP_000857-RA/>CCRYP_000857-RA protein AED:0.17 eAED:0.17 QI:0/-1/0/1/-1/1/1/0/290
MKPITSILFTAILAQSKALTHRPSMLVHIYKSKSSHFNGALTSAGQKPKQSRIPAKIDPIFIRGGSTSLQTSFTNDLVTTLIPRIGVLTSTLLYFSPYATVKKATTIDSIGELNPIPLAIMAVSSLCWLAYGLSIRDAYVTLSNVPGCVVSIWYVTSLLPLLKGKILRTTQTAVVALSAATISLWTWLSLSNKAMSKVSSALGLYASFLFIILSASPLATIKTVIEAKNSNSILTPLTLAQVTNTALWSAYGLAIQDKFVWGPNVTGLGFGIIQLLLKILFPSKSLESVN